MMTVSDGDINSYVIPRHVIRLESSAAIELTKNNAGDNIHRVFCVQNCRLSSVSYSLRTRHTAMSLSHAFPIPQTVTKANTPRLTQTGKLFVRFRIMQSKRRRALPGDKKTGANE